jgi:hypothetical protein
MIEAQPETPAMMIKSQRKKNGEDNQEPDDQLIFKAEERQRDEIHNQNQELRRHHVSHNRTHEKTVFTLEQRAA